jgi:pimeloyl-ACP methyl ester carboxylesterase
VTVNYQTYGDGEHKVLVLHGWFGDASSWLPWCAQLDADRFSYAFVDCRGYGGSSGISGEYTIEEIAADTVAVADDLGWETFSLIGHSMGGSAVQKVVTMASDRVRRLVGISPVPASGVPFDEDAWALFSGAADDPDNRRAIIDLTTGNRLTSTWLDRMVDRSLSTSEREAFAAYLSAWAKTDFHEEVKGKPLPVKVIVGEHDPALGADVMKQTFLEWYPNAELEVLANAGHYAMEETPVALATSVEDFLAADSTTG